MTIENQPTEKEMRQLEVATYQANIERFKTIYATLPKEWPAHLVKHRDAENHHDEITKVENVDDIELVSKLWYADQCAKFIRTETVEMVKAKAILDAMI